MSTIQHKMAPTSAVKRAEHVRRATELADELHACLAALGCERICHSAHLTREQVHEIAEIASMDVREYPLTSSRTLGPTVITELQLGALYISNVSEPSSEDLVRWPELLCGPQKYSA